MTRHFAPAKHWFKVLEHFSNKLWNQFWAKHTASMNYIQAGTGRATSHLYQYFIIRLIGMQEYWEKGRHK
jgi:hypothetical protein